MHARVTPASLVLLCLIAQSAMAQDKPAPKHDDLDVTMQIIADPDAKVPDEVVRHIPLPARKPPAAPATNATDAAKPDAEAKELGRETAERAKERAHDAAEQREQARRSMADERRRRNPSPPDPPPRPPRR